MEATVKLADQANRLVAAGQAVTVRVPATSANLGPGFDSLGLAVSLYDTVDVVTTEAPGVEVHVDGEGQGQVPLNDAHLVVRTLLGTLDGAGFGAHGLRLSAHNAIPHGRGLGSSASAIVTGVLAANALLPDFAKLDDAAVLQRCSELEGHPDNVAPALFGGLTVSWDEDGCYRTTRVGVAPDVVPVVAIPDVELPTKAARALLPSTVPHRQAAANSGRAALLIHAISSEPNLLLAGTRDSLHQDYRAEAMQPSADLLAELRSKGFAAVISGAGPTVLVLANGPAQADAVEALVAARGALVIGADSGDMSGGETGVASGNDAESRGVTWRVLRLSVDTEGARVEVHPRK